MGCGLGGGGGGGTVALGEKWTSPGRSQNPGQEASHQCEKHLGRIPPAGGGRQLPGCDARSATYPVDDVH